MSVDPGAPKEFYSPAMKLPSVSSFACSVFTAARNERKTRPAIDPAILLSNEWNLGRGTKVQAQPRFYFLSLSLALFFFLFHFYYDPQLVTFPVRLLFSFQ